MSAVPPPPPPPTPTPPPGTPGPWGAEPPRPRLARRSTDKVLGGVCGGVADHLGVDVNVIRVATVLLAMTGWGVLLYLIGWVALPVSDAPPRPAGRGHRGRTPWLPIILVIALLFTVPSGFSVLFGDVHFGNGAVPILLLGGVAYLMWRATHGDLPRRPGRPRPPVGGQGWTAPPPPRPPIQAQPPVAPTESADPPLWARDTASPAAPSRPAGDAGTPTAPGEAPTADPDEDPLLAEARRLSDPFLTEPLLFETAPAPATSVPASPPLRRGGGRALLAGLLIGVGAVGLAWALGASLSPFTVLAGALIGFGVALVFGGFSGRSNRGLIIPGLVVFGLLSVAAALDLDLPSGGAGERLYQPTVVSEIRDSYELGLGELTIDLSNVDFSSDDDIEVAAQLGAGELRVFVPDDVAVIVDATAKAGEIRVLDEAQEGINPEVSARDEGSREGGTLTLDLEVGLGELSVDRSGAGAERPEIPEVPDVPLAPEAPSVP